LLKAKWLILKTGVRGKPERCNDIINTCFSVCYVSVFNRSAAIWFLFLMKYKRPFYLYNFNLPCLFITNITLQYQLHNWVQAASTVKNDVDSTVAEALRLMAARREAGDNDFDEPPVLHLAALTAKSWRERLATIAWTNYQSFQL
jgi:hypothetical protein